MCIQTSQGTPVRTETPSLAPDSLPLCPLPFPFPPLLPAISIHKFTSPAPNPLPLCPGISAFLGPPAAGKPRRRPPVARPPPPHGSSRRLGALALPAAARRAAVPGPGLRPAAPRGVGEGPARGGRGLGQVHRPSSSYKLAHKYDLRSLVGKGSRCVSSSQVSRLSTLVLMPPILPPSMSLGAGRTACRRPTCCCCACACHWWPTSRRCSGCPSCCATAILSCLQSSGGRLWGVRP